MQLFYHPDFSESSFYLEKLESGHCIRVLRHKIGDEIQVVDGKGNFATCVITEASSKACRVEIKKIVREYGKRDYYLHVAIAPPKINTRFEWFLEKAMEIGIDEITPIITERSDRKEFKIEKWEKVLISAMKQSLKAYIPQINLGIKFHPFVMMAQEEQLLLGDCDITEDQHLTKIAKKEKRTLIVIGPAGDLTMDEKKIAYSNGFKPFSLGSSRLRTETAGLASVFALNFVNS